MTFFLSPVSSRLSARWPLRVQILFTAGDLDWAGENLVWAFVAWQYGVFMCLALFAVIVPDVSNAVTIQLGRQSFIVSKVIDQVRAVFFVMGVCSFFRFYRRIPAHRSISLNMRRSQGLSPPAAWA